ALFDSREKLHLFPDFLVRRGVVQARPGNHSAVPKLIDMAHHIWQDLATQSRHSSCSAFLSFVDAQDLVNLHGISISLDWSRKPKVVQGPARRRILAADVHAAQLISLFFHISFVFT